MFIDTPCPPRGAASVVSQKSANLSTGGRRISPTLRFVHLSEIAVAVESPDKTNAYKRVQCGRREVGFRKPLWIIALSVVMVLVNLTVCGEVSESTAAKINATISKFNLEKQNRSKVQTKIDSALLERQDGLGTVLSRMGQEETNADDVVECEITGAISDRLVELIEGHGGVVTFKSVKYGSLSCRLPVSAIESIAADKDVRRIKRIHGSLLNKSNTSQGDTAHKAQQARSTFNVSGKGVKVGVISDSARYASEMQATGDLPYTLTVLPGYEGVRYDGGERVDTGEGSGMMEIVYDLAPDAGLYFATGWGTIPQFAAAVDELSAAGGRIIVDDVSKFNESALQDSVIVDAINRFTENGGIYFSSAANSGNLTAGTSGTWEGDFSASTHSSGSISGTFHSFGQSSNVYLNELTQAGSAIILQWADPWGASSNDYDLYAFDSNGNVLAKSTDTQDGSGDPFEIIYTSGVNMRVYIAVVKYSGEGRYLRIDTARGRLQYATAGSTYGHNAADRAFSVAAAAAPTGRAFVSTDSLESYSSDGPRKVFFNHNGVKIGASGYLSTGGVTLNKPDITAADATLSRWTALAYGESSFGGTSAAAPHAAAIVALMLEANPSLTRDDVFSILTNTTFSKPSWNRNKGYGIIDAYAAVDAAKNAEPKLELGEDNKTIGAEGGSVSVTVSANVDWTVSKSAGAAWLNLSNSSGNGDGAVSFTVDRNNKTNARNATLTITGEGLTRTCAILQEGMTTPVRPVVTASDGVSSESITVKWENCARALSYSLERAESAAGNKVLLDADARSPYVDVNVTPGKTYYYWVTAVNEVGSNESSYDSGYRSISLSLDAGGNVYTKDGGESSFSVSGNSSWTVTCADEWITLGTTSGSGSGVVSFTVEKNYDGETRYGSIVVTSGSVTKTITVTQPGRVLVVANSGSITINTGASSPSFYVSSKGKTYYGTIVGGAAVYKFDYLEIGSAVSVSVSGSRPLVIESETDMKVACDFDVSGTSTGRCGGGVGGAGGSGGSTVTGGSGGSGGTRGSGGNGYTVSSYSGTTQGQSGSSGGAGGTGYNGSAGNYGTSGSSGGKGFGSTGSAASGGSRGSGGSAGSAASSVGSAGSGGYAGSDGSAGGSGTKGNAGGAGNDGAAGSNGANAFTTALTSDVIMAGSGGGGSGGGGGGGGGGTSQSEAASYSGNSIYINRKVYQGAIGGFGGTGGNGGKGATSGAGGSGGTGGHGGGAIVLKAAGVMELSGCVDVSAANGSRGGSSGSSASSASSGVSGGSGSAGQGALNLQTFSSLYPSSGHKGGNGGTGGAGGNAGKGGAGGAGGYGAPGMVKLYASVLLASDGRVSGANGDNSTTASRCGGLTLATNMKSAALTAQKPTVATTIKCGERAGSPSLKVASVYDEDVTVPVVGQLKVSHADASGVCESGNYAFSLVSSQSAEGTVEGLTIKRLTTLFDGYDQIFLINSSSAKIGPVEVKINGVACSIPELSVGEAWTTCVQSGVTVSGGEVPPLAPTAVTASDGAYFDKVVVSWTGSSGTAFYTLYRSTTSTRPSEAIKTSVTSPCSDTTAVPGTKYYYWVSAVNSAGASFSTSDTGYRAVSLALGKSSDSYTADGGSGSASVTANTSWSATKNVSWITLGTSSGSGNGTLTYTVAANSSADSRTGTITVTAGSGTTYPATRSITVTQEGVSEFVIVDGVLTKYTGAGGAVTIPSGVRSIGPRAFEWNSGLTTVTITEGVTNIANYAFVGASLTSVSIPASVRNIGDGAFQQCDYLKTVTIAEGLRSIGRQAFSYCAQLTTISIPATTAVIGASAFWECPALPAIPVAEGNATYSSIDGVLYDKAQMNLILCPHGKSGSITIPSSVTNIHRDAVSNCRKMTEFVVAQGNRIYSSVDGIIYDKDMSVVIQCPAGKVGSVEIPYGVTTIKEYSFEFCSKLTELSIPSSVLQIGDSAFEYCYGLTSLMIPSSVREIEAYAFIGCSGLQTVIISEGVQTIGDWAFDECIKLSSVVIPSTVTSLGSAFYECSGLTSVTIPSSVKSIGTYAFSGCDKLTTVYVSAGDADRIASLYAFDDSVEFVEIVDPPPVPTGVSASDGAYTDKVSISWTGSSGATSYNLYRSTTSTRPSTAIKTGVTSLYSDTTATPGTKYYYWVSAVNSAGASYSTSDTGYRAVALALGKSTDSYTADGGSGSATVTANTSWSATKNVSWITLGTSFGNGNGTLTYTVDANTSLESRTGTITVAAGSGTSYPATPRTITVTQNGGSIIVATPVITPADGATFSGDSCTVTITCATEGATIYYSTNGSSPRLKDQFKYTQPFTVTETTTVKAVAVKDGFTQSEIATAVITKVDPPPPTLTSALDEPKLSVVETDGDAEWEPVKDVTAVGGSSARSGEIGMLQRTCLKATVYGKGTLSFNWKVSCEDDYSGLYTYDHLTFSTVEGGRTNDIAKIDGETEWLPGSVTFTTDGPHVILWTYSTDDWEEPGFEDCGWVDNVVWTGDAPPSDIVISDVVTLPKAEVESFMAKYPSLAAQVGGDAEAFAKLPSATGKDDANGNQMYVWQDILAGTDPTNPDDKFKIVDLKFEDGELKVFWSPDLNENGTKSVRAYTEYGRKELGGSEKWTDMKDVNPAEKNDYKFRKVTVDMP